LPGAHAPIPAERHAEREPLAEDGFRIIGMMSDEKKKGKFRVKVIYSALYHPLEREKIGER
jgi:hypothetical protein